MDYQPPLEDSASRPLDFAGALRTWASRDVREWSKTPRPYQNLAGRFLELAEPLLAFDVASEGLSHFSGDLRLRQLQALALARLGAAREALEIIGALHREGQQDEETLGILARVHKHLWLAGPDSKDAREHLAQAAQLYRQAYQLTQGIWTGINAATLTLLGGEVAQARQMAEEILTRCLEATRAGDVSYWNLATLGEAGLLLGDWAQAETWYARAARKGRGNFGDWAATRRNAEMVMERLECPAASRNTITSLLTPPRVAVFAGHMLDRPLRARPRFPAQREAEVKAALQEKLSKINARIGYASAACGADILFHEALAELGGESQVVLPYGQAQFIQDSVDLVPGSGWVERFRKVLDGAAEVVVLSEHKLPVGSASYEYSNRFLLGLAGIRARQLETGLVGLAVWDGRPGDGQGGTADAVLGWRQSGLAVETIDPAQPAAAAAVGAEEPTPAPVNVPAPEAEFTSRVMSLLFADVVGFTRLSEGQIPLFVEHFMKPMAALAEASAHAPLTSNSWGDGLYLVFENTGQACGFALELRDLMTATDWAQKGLPGDFSLRIALHAGPVYGHICPLTRRRTFTGTHVSRAARIEPITPPGHVYASRSFAALAFAEGVKDFDFQYVGQTPWAKGFGTFPTYRVGRVGS